MKKLLALLLVLTMVLSMGACGKKNPEEAAAAMSLEQANQLGSTVEYTLVYGYAAEKVLPPIPSSVYSYYEADAGNTYITLVMDVKNLDSKAVDADQLMDVKLQAGAAKFDSNCVVEEDGGTDLGYSNITQIQPLETARLYYLFETPATVDTSNLRVTVSKGRNNQQSALDLAIFKDRVQTWYSGQAVTDDNTLHAQLEGIYFSDTLYPPHADGYYHYYEADQGKTYLIAKMTVKNLKGTDLEYDAIAGVSCVYDGKYTYQAATVHEAEEGADLNDYSSEAIKPLETGILYYMMEVPEEVENGPVVVKFYCLGQYYEYPLP